MPQYRHLACPKDEIDIINRILSPYSGSAKHHQTKQKRNQMSLEASSIRDSTITPIFQPIVKTYPTGDCQR